jgi:uncharacterized membrane protein
LISQTTRSGDKKAQANVAQSPRSSELHSVLVRNIHLLEERRAREKATATLEERIAGAITRFAGSMRFVYLQIVLCVFWVAANLGQLPGVPRFDPTFMILAVAVSVEAIFLSTFILITQNQMSVAAEKRAELDLQISLLSEHEITKLAGLLSAIAERMGIESEVDAEVEELKQDVAPEAVLDEIEERLR